jgi:AraC-like DNA-binding protein
VHRPPVRRARADALQPGQDVRPGRQVVGLEQPHGGEREHRHDVGRGERRAGEERHLAEPRVDGGQPPPAAPARALAVQACDARLVDALHRYLDLAGSPADAAVLGPLVTREIHYRLAIAPFGGMLRDLIRHDSQASAIARAIARLRREFRSPIEIPELARSVGMSASSFHQHFKAITSASPLQYRKGLQLLEARRMLRAGACAVTGAAFDVGYESAAQFSRDYSRRFGVSPRHDLPAG